ncbi:hypothetical protein EXIGLDRAFT_780691 [Exidia glandulosa HHB12029]|uniref:Aminoglycoside phosphotransferase domain-containing protein n=1 Tax=Exidia glandulosa HHB12029 TaxID=1314781 RepID=A0A165BHC9_EXIGL|nr:hypothetical protein EXIGLDRAFT_780691 [Exidia glandulosa HHB12029]
MLGAANAVYDLRFSDGSAWVIRIPFPHSESSMRRNENGHFFVASNRSIPIPKVHSYALDSNNALGHPYMIMDFAQGTRLIDVCHLARHMVQLSSLEFTDIGQLERDDATGEHFIAAFSSRLKQCPMAKGPDYAIGPFRTQNEFFKALLNSARVDAPPWPELALMEFFTSTLLDPRYNDGPFTLCHPDFDCQNVLIDNTTGEVTAIIDWDGSCALPRQLGALSYPSWLIVDRNPWVYESSKNTNHFDLHEYRTIYVDAIRACGGDALADTTLNSHIASAIYAALSQL